MFRRPLFRISTLIPALLAALFGLILTGCAAGSGTPNQPRGSSNLADVTVSGVAGQKPSLKVPTPFTVTKTENRIVKPGNGMIVVPGERVSIDYVGVNGADGKEFDTSFGKTGTSAFLLSDQVVIKGMVSGLSGVAVGSRVLIAVPPQDGYGNQGVAAAGIGPTDTLLFLVDVRSAGQVLKRATGTPVKPAAGLPAVTLDKATGRPRIVLPAGKAPAKLVARPLIAGKGPKVTKGATITVQYSGVIWPGGRQFDSSWDRQAPATFAIGVGKVIAGWDEGLVGQPVGSQVLLIVPPDKGYGATGRPENGIKGTDTLVFVVDILDSVPA